MMKRLATAAFFALFFALPTVALALAGQQRTIVMQPPGWISAGQSVALDFADRRYWVRGQGYQSPLTLTSTSRASVKNCQRLDGIWIQFPSNIPAICDSGALIEESRVNDALQSRDMTQAAWVKASGGTTVALNAVGIDGAANSASTLTAAGVAASCAANVCNALQTITLGSSADTYSVWLKRVSGSGAVSITINNLAGTTACTLTTTAFTRCSVTATLANPVFGVAMATIGDVIVADGNQLEPGSFATSPIFTTTTPQTRAADAVKYIGAFLTTLNPASFGSVYMDIANQNTVNVLQLNIDAASANNFIKVSSTTVVRTIQNSVATSATIGSGNSLTKIKASVAWSSAGVAVVGNNGTVATSANVFTAANQTNNFIMSQNGSASFPNGSVLAMAAWRNVLSNAALAATTILNGVP